MGANETSELRTHAVYEALRADLLESRIRPGERLKFLDLAERFGNSQTVVREALTRLSEEGLVISSPKRGFSVMTLSTSDLIDLTNLRLSVEVGALRSSVKNGDLTWEREVVSAHHVLERTPLPNGTDHGSTWRQRHRDFHAALCSGCGSPRLQKLTSQLRDAAELYRIWSRPSGFHVGRDFAGEHKAIVQAALARDEASAADLLSLHLNRTTHDLLLAAEKIVDK
ncbi:GntR family transcriptional regulator [Ochrobactrum sp. Q0168]|uniref:GntR family transcriptional regulator n=1 Tax=Ochrobactrum sp. Q0168 TaxID=2793241 RepID=UPI0018EC8391|nr:GntR family transcriptional regulator [Ochrobactrum sp. Q0168]